MGGGNRTRGRLDSCLRGWGRHGLFLQGPGGVIPRGGPAHRPGRGRPGSDPCREGGSLQGGSRPAPGVAKPAEWQVPTRGDVCSRLPAPARLCFQEREGNAWASTLQGPRKRG